LHEKHKQGLLPKFQKNQAQTVLLIARETQARSFAKIPEKSGAIQYFQFPRFSQRVQGLGVIWKAVLFKIVKKKCQRVRGLGPKRDSISPPEPLYAAPDCTGNTSKVFCQNSRKIRLRLCSYDTFGTFS
jgi:hypothetical protein